MVVSKAILGSGIMLPKSFKAYNSLGEAYLKAGNRELAIANYERPLILNFRGKLQFKALAFAHQKIHLRPESLVSCPFALSNHGDFSRMTSGVSKEKSWRHKRGRRLEFG